MAGLAVVPAQAAPVSYAGGTYTQNFDTLPTSGGESEVGDFEEVFAVPGQAAVPSVTEFADENYTAVPGWYMVLVSPLNQTGQKTDFHADDGSLVVENGGSWSFLSLGEVDSTERALGSKGSGAPVLPFGLQLVNDSGNTLTQFTLSYTGEQWAANGGDDVDPPLEFSYLVTSDASTDQLIASVSSNIAIDEEASPDTMGSGTPVSALDFAPIQSSATPVVLDGNDAANRAQISHTVTGIDWAPGEVLWLTWSRIREGNSSSLAVDDVSFAAAVPEPASLAMLGLAGGLMLTRRRRTT